jgi:dTDP-4-dehydrorhamnose 3,5-epimerase
MRFRETPLSGAFVIEIERLGDSRGSFARTFSTDAWIEHGLNPRVAQCNVSSNSVRGTLRGMHYQAEPKPEAKLVRCTRGAIHDVIVDLRPHSATLCDWFSIHLTDSNDVMLYVPEGFAHGFLTLADDTEVFYVMSDLYERDLARGVRWDDPAFSIEWPEEVRVISDRDSKFPDFAA